MESVRRNNRDAERSDDSSSQDTQENPATNRMSAIHAILENLIAVPATSETLASAHDIKIEMEDTYNTEDENSHSESTRKSPPGHSPRKRLRAAASASATEDEPVESAEPKIAYSNSGTTSRINDVEHHGGINFESLSDTHDMAQQRAMWLCKSSQREHEIKLRMLQLELERAELQKQTALNELKTSEIKRQLIESQAAEYFRSIERRYSIRAS